MKYVKVQIPSSGGSAGEGYILLSKKLSTKMIEVKCILRVMSHGSTAWLVMLRVNLRGYSFVENWPVTAMRL